MMVQKNQIGEILNLYAKHGWKLRRVLLSAESRKTLGEAASELFSGADLRDSDLDAAWFARSSKPGDETWELRSMGPEPFALCEVFSEEDEEETREEAMFEMEERLRDRRR